jgi:hypothetical protein
MANHYIFLLHIIDGSCHRLSSFVSRHNVTITGHNGASYVCKSPLGDHMGRIYTDNTQKTAKEVALHVVLTTSYTDRRLLTAAGKMPPARRVEGHSLLQSPVEQTELGQWGEKLPLWKKLLFPGTRVRSSRSIKIWRVAEMLGWAVFSVALGQIFTLKLCDFFFRCGCTWPWDGGVKRCNIFTPGVPHCPWCAAPQWISWTPQWGSAVVVFFVGGAFRHWWFLRRDKRLASEQASLSSGFESARHLPVHDTIVNYDTEGPGWNRACCSADEVRNAAWRLLSMIVVGGIVFVVYSTVVAALFFAAFPEYPHFIVENAR